MESFAGRNFRLVDTAGLTRTRPVLSLVDTKAQKRSTLKHESLSLAAYADNDALEVLYSHEQQRGAQPCRDEKFIWSCQELTI